MKNLTTAQWLGIAIATVSVLAVAPDQQMYDLFGKAIAVKVQAASGLLTLILGGVVAAITGQSGPAQMAQQLLDKGGAKLVVDASAPKDLAKLAMSPENNGVEAAPGHEAAVAAKAKS